MTRPIDEGGDPACWAHLFGTPESDIVDRADVEHFVRDFYRQAAMDDVLGPVFAATQMNWNAHIETLSTSGRGSCSATAATRATRCGRTSP